MTAQQIIEGALRLIRRLAPGDGQTVPAEELADCLEALNMMINAWQATSRMGTLVVFDSISESSSMSDIYDEALKYNLAIRLHPEYGKGDLNPEVVAIANSSKGTIEATNLGPAPITPDTAHLGRGGNSYGINRE